MKFKALTEKFTSYFRRLSGPNRSSLLNLIWITTKSNCLLQEIFSYEPPSHFPIRIGYYFKPIDAHISNFIELINIFNNTIIIIIVITMLFFIFFFFFLVSIIITFVLITSIKSENQHPFYQQLYFKSIKYFIICAFISYYIA